MYIGSSRYKNVFLISLSGSRQFARSPCVHCPNGWPDQALPMASTSSVWTRPKSSSRDPSKLALLAERVKAVMGKSVYPDAKRISPHEVGVSPLNRLFSVHQAHNTILKSFVKEGHDPGRPQVGICCEVRGPRSARPWRNSMWPCHRARP